MVYKKYIAFRYSYKFNMVNILRVAFSFIKCICQVQSKD